MTDRNRQLGNYDADSIVPGVRLIMAIAQRVSRATLDYALGAAILGVVPLYGRWIPLIRLTLLTLINLKMIKDIGRFWGYHRGQGWGEIISCGLGIIASIALGLMVWLAMLLLGLLIPYIDILARAIAYGILTYNIGRTMSRYYYSPQTLNVKALQKAWRFERSQPQPQNRKP